MLVAVAQAAHPPCIRMMLRGNSLHIVTIMGATIGRSSECDIRLAELSEVSRLVSQYTGRVHHLFNLQSTLHDHL
jgi:hypothetical protein